MKVTELNLLVNRVEEDYFLRKIIFENNEWKILLNDIDVKNIIKKYQRIISINKKNRKIIQKEFLNSNDKFDSKSVSFNVFVSNCEYEYFRFERYGRLFTIMKLEFQTEINSLENEDKGTFWIYSNWNWIPNCNNFYFNWQFY